MYDPDIFSGAGEKLPNTIFETYGSELDVEPEMLQAITIHESPRGSYLGDGRLRILYEAHVFSRLTKHKYDDKHPGISSRRWDRKLYGAPGTHQHNRLSKAMSLNEDAALQSCSYGMFQIMGFHYADLGYRTPREMVDAFAESEVAQFEGFISLLKKKKLLSALRTRDYELIGYRYNGPGYRKNNYHVHLARIYRELKSNVLRKGSRGQKVVTLQNLLIKHGFKGVVKADGHFGEKTKASVIKFQTREGLAPDGVVGAATYAALASKRAEQTPLHKSKRVGGSTVTGGLGVGSVLEGIEVVKKANDKVGQIVESPVGEIVKQNATPGYVMIGLGMVLVCLAAYFVWTKIYDMKQGGGA